MNYLQAAAGVLRAPVCTLAGAFAVVKFAELGYRTVTDLYQSIEPKFLEDFRASITSNIDGRGDDSRLKQVKNFIVAHLPQVSESRTALLKKALLSALCAAAFFEVCLLIGAKSPALYSRVALPESFLKSGYAATQSLWGRIFNRGSI